MPEPFPKRIFHILDELKTNPHILVTFDLPEFEIVDADFRKRFSEFYRVRAWDAKAKKRSLQYFWIKIVKNKDPQEILASLDKQYDTIRKFYAILEKTEQHYRCCQPIEYFRHHYALVTRECNGTLFNRYLKYNAPFYRNKKIIDYCYHLGRLLYLFHFHFSKQTEDTGPKDQIIAGFQKKFHRSPSPEMDMITLCHNDFSPRNLFVSETSVEVIDFVGVQKGLAQEDIMLFCNYVYKARFNFFYSKAYKLKMIQSFLNGYGLKNISINDVITAEDLI